MRIYIFFSARTSHSIVIECLFASFSSLSMNTKFDGFEFEVIHNITSHIDIHLITVIAGFCWHLSHPTLDSHNMQASRWNFSRNWNRFCSPLCEICTSIRFNKIWGTSVKGLLHANINKSKLWVSRTSSVVYICCLILCWLVFWLVVRVSIGWDARWCCSENKQEIFIWTTKKSKYNIETERKKKLVYAFSTDDSNWFE